jgi:hypothetical protein
MELLGSGGFNHWTNKKKSRLIDRALQQVNQSAEADADKAVTDLLNQTALSKRSTLDISFLQKIYNYSIYGHVSGATGGARSNCCWFTLLDNETLNAEGDVLCITAFIPQKARNIALCSVSSSMVVKRPVMQGQISICPAPMSFMTIRGVLQAGKSFSRGPHGSPINTCVCMLPEPDSVLSTKIAFAYQPLSTSQLLTTRWSYTVVSFQFL